MAEGRWMVVQEGMGLASPFCNYGPAGQPLLNRRLRGGLHRLQAKHRESVSMERDAGGKSFIAHFTTQGKIISYS